MSGDNPSDFVVTDFDSGNLDSHFIYWVFKPSDSGSRSASIDISITTYKYDIYGNLVEDQHLLGHKVVTDTGVLAPVKPGKSENDVEIPIQCVKKTGLTGSQCTSGNSELDWRDPIQTRGYPLTNNIHFNTQHTDTSRAMGNATFTYDIHLIKSAQVFVGYDSTQRHWEVIDGDGTIVDFGLSASSPTPGRGVFSSLVVSGNSYVLTASAPEHLRKAGNFQYVFDSNGKLLSITDPKGNVQNLIYSSSQLTSVQDVNTGLSIAFTYTSGKITCVSENNGACRTYLAYTNERLTSITVKNPDDTTATSVALDYYDSKYYHWLKSITHDGDSATTCTFLYDVRDGVEGKVGLTNVHTDLSTTQIAYGLAPASGATSRVGVTNYKGGTTYYDLSASGDVVQVTMPAYAGASQATTYSLTYSNGLPTGVMGPDGTRSATYDARGNMTSFTDELGRTTNMTYNGVDLLTVRDTLGTYLTLSYENALLPHAPTSVVDAYGNASTISYNSYGQPLAVSPPTGSSIGSLTASYNETSGSNGYGYPALVQSGDQKLAFNSYDGLGNVTSSTTYPDTGATRKCFYTYDALSRPKLHQNANGTIFKTIYSGRQPYASVDEAGAITYYTYGGPCGLLLKVSAPLGWQISRRPDMDRDIVQFTDALKRVTTYAYGLNRELTTITYPDGSTQKAQYNASGRVAQTTNGAGLATNYEYNAAGQVTRRYYGSTDERFYYNADGTLEHQAGNGCTTAYVYDSNRRVVSVTYNFGSASGIALQKVTYDRAVDGRVQSVSWYNGTTLVNKWDYTLTKAGQIATVTNAYHETTSYLYDGEGSLWRQYNANGTSTIYTHDFNGRGWLRQITHLLGTTTFSSYKLTYDLGADTAGNLTSVVESDGSRCDYGYDALYRLTTERRAGTTPYGQSNGYDLAGNLTNVGGKPFAKYDPANKLTTLTGGSVKNDGNGNLVSISGPSVPTLSCKWDERDKLTSASTTATSVAYAYGPDGKRAWSQVGSNAKTYYVYDGNRLLGEMTANGPTAIYTWGPGGLISERVAALSASFWYHYGPQGETRWLTKLDGSVTDSYKYSAYGQTLASSGTTPNAFRYGGRWGYYTDGQTGLMLCSARWYSPYVMRWLSRDPARYRGGSNLLAYCRENPTRFVDPSGRGSEDSKQGGAPDLSGFGDDCRNSSFGRDDPSFCDNPQVAFADNQRKIFDLARKGAGMAMPESGLAGTGAEAAGDLESFAGAASEALGNGYDIGGNASDLGEWKDLGDQAKELADAANRGVDAEAERRAREDIQRDLSTRQY